MALNRNNGGAQRIEYSDYDLGDPDDVREEIETKIKEYVAEGTKAIATALGAGAAEADQIAGSEVVDVLAHIFSLGFVALLGLGDDEIGRGNIEVGMRELVRLSKQENVDKAMKTTPAGKKYTHSVDLKSRNGHYRAYFRIRAQEIPAVMPGPDI